MRCRFLHFFFLPFLYITQSLYGADSSNGPLIVQPEKKWLELLGKERYRVMRQKGTEKAFSGVYLNEEKAGVYACFACENPLFRSEDRYEEPGSGWLAFSQPIGPKNVFYREDWDLPFKRYQVLCRNCESHLGHVFHDGPPPKHLRFTINSIALKHHSNSSIRKTKN